MAENLQHEDFGEKIGGAKKDLWKDRGLYVDDLGAMNEREAEKFVKKDNVWKKPDYQAMLDDGVPLGVVYFIKKARDSLGASPQYRYSDKTPELRRARQEEYIETVRQLQAVIEDVRTLDDAMQAYDRFLIQNGYVEQVQGWASGTHYRATKKSLDNPVITNKLVQALHIRSASHFDRDFTQKAQQEQFGVSKDQKMPKGYAIHFNDGKNTYSRNNDWKPGTYYVTKGYSILQTNLESREAALKWVQDFARQRSKGGKVRFTPPQLAHVRRTGPDYRSGQEITGQHYLDTFGFRGGEFGNWMNQNDRQASLNMGFEALKDLAAALQISDQDIAFGGTLAIAFGARGSGNAAAHYEPLRKVINLTKMHGAGSLAHEWWHGFDDYLGAKMGAKGMLSEQPRLYPLFQKLIDTMKYALMVQPDDMLISPREVNDNFGTMVCFHPRYALGDHHNYIDKDDFLREMYLNTVGNNERGTERYERMVNMVWSRKMTGDHPDPRAVDDAMLRVISEKYVVMPLYLLDHSGLAMQTESFHDPWDSGQVGWVYVSKEDVLKEFGGEKMTGALRKKAEDLLRGEVAEYDAYLRGECYGFELYKNGELSDSCWGFIGSLEDACKAMADYLPDECKGMTEHLSEVKEPASMIKTLLRHARIQIEQAEKAHEHAPRQQVLSEAR